MKKYQCLSEALQGDEAVKYVDAVSYSMMLKAYLASSRMEEARALVKEFPARGLPANKVTYNELLNAKVVSCDRQGMWAIVDEMLGAGLKVNLITCSILLVEALGFNRLGEETLQLVQEQPRCEDRESMINTVADSTVLKGVAVLKCINKVVTFL